MSNRAKLMAALVVLVGIFLFAKMRKSTPKSVTVAEAPTVKGPKGKTLKAKAPTAEPKVQKRLTEAANMGFLNVPVKLNGSKVDVTIEVAVKEQCEPGDLDVIEIETRTAEKGRLLLTVEPVDGGDPLSVRKVTVDDLKKGVTETVSIPNADDPRPLGAYLCLDSKGEGRCGTKPFGDMVYAYQKDTKGVQDKTGHTHSQDKTYFFEYFQVQQGTLQVMGSTSPKESQYADLAATYKKGVSSRERAEDLVNKIKLAHRQTTSMPPEVTAKGMKFVLPDGHKPGCKPLVNPLQPKRVVVHEGDFKVPPQNEMSPPPKVWTMSDKDRKPPPPPAGVIGNFGKFQ